MIKHLIRSDTLFLANNSVVPKRSTRCSAAQPRVRQLQFVSIVCVLQRDVSFFFRDKVRKLHSSTLDFMIVTYIFIFFLLESLKFWYVVVPAWTWVVDGGRCHAIICSFCVFYFRISDDLKWSEELCDCGGRFRIRESSVIMPIDWREALCIFYIRNRHYLEDLLRILCASSEVPLILQLALSIWNEAALKRGDNVRQKRRNEKNGTQKQRYFFIVERGEALQLSQWQAATVANEKTARCLEILLYLLRIIVF